MTSAMIYVIVLFTCANAAVDFSFSTLYDIHDFVGQANVWLPKCDFGCLIFASTMPGTFLDSPDGLDPYAKNLVIVNSNNADRPNIADLSKKVNAASLKTPLEIKGPVASVSVSNLNSVRAASSDIVLYVVDTSKANEFLYGIYDAAFMPLTSIVPNSKISVMSAAPFSVIAPQMATSNSVTARLVGFDNILDTNPDLCPYAFKTEKNSKLEGFNLQINGPIISFGFGEGNVVKLQANLNFKQQQDLAKNGFVSTSGYNGCKNPDNGGIQSFRMLKYSPDDSYLLSANQDYKVTIDVEPTLDDTHVLSVIDASKRETKKVTGSELVNFVFPQTQNVKVQFQDFNGNQGFILRHSAVALDPAPVPTGPVIPSVSTTTTKSSVSTTTITPTTSSSWSSNGILVPLFAVASYYII